MLRILWLRWRWHGSRRGLAGQELIAHEAEQEQRDEEDDLFLAHLHLVILPVGRFREPRHGDGQVEPRLTGLGARGDELDVVHDQGAPVRRPLNPSEQP